MNATPKTHATQVRKAAARRVAVTRDIRVKAFTSETGVVRPMGKREVFNSDPTVCVWVARYGSHGIEESVADLAGDRSIGYCICGEYVDTGTWDERNA